MLRTIAFGGFFSDKRSFTFGAGSGQWFVPKCIFAFWISRTGVKKLATSRFFLQIGPFFTLWTGNAGIQGFFEGLVVATVWIAGACQIFAITSLFDQHGFVTFFAQYIRHHRLGNRFVLFPLFFNISGKFALWIVGTRIKASKSTQFNQKGLIALGTLFIGNLRGNISPACAFLFFVYLFFKRCPKGVQQRNPKLFASGDRIQFIFQIGGKVIVHIGAKMFHQKFIDHHSHIFWEKFACLQSYITPIL